MEQNSWMVAENVADRINHEPGPAGDLYPIILFCDSTQEEHFFL